jgi:hypothetical protein
MLQENRGSHITQRTKTAPQEETEPKEKKKTLRKILLLYKFSKRDKLILIDKSEEKELGLERSKKSLI